MKRIQKIIVLTLFGGMLSVGINGQTKSVQADPASFPEVSLKNSKIVPNQDLRGEDILWKREVYRMVDLTNGLNGSLYFPVEPTADRKNLFCTIFELIASGKLTAYEYLDGREVFNESYALKFKEMLKRFEIPFREKPDPKKANSSIFDIDAVDIPSSEVTLFYVKEAYYLEQRNSTVGTRTLAICPVLIRTDEVGETRKYPMFWIPFSTLKEHLSQIPVWSDTINSVSRMNAYDFFNLRRYTGDIYKVSNLRNQTLWDYCDSPETIKTEQTRLENELKNLDESMWEVSQHDVLEAKAKQEAEAKLAAKSAVKKKRAKK
jgi:gliding motility associated protien GldN